MMIKSSRSRELELVSTPGINSSTNLMNWGLNSPKYAESFRGDSFPASYVGMVMKEFRVGVALD